MQKYSIRKLAIAALTLFLVLGFLLVDSSAQKRKRRRKSSTPKITNPAIYEPSPTENANAANDNTTSGNETVNSQTNTQTPRATNEDPEEMKRTIRSLSNQVDRLSEKLSAMEQSQRSLVDLERLSRGEQRSAQLHAELRDVQSKQSELQAHLEDVEFALKPENIERATAGYGTTHPEELREQRRKQLESEKQRVQKQLDELSASETRLQTAIAATDTEVDTLHKKLDAADQAAIENAKTKAQTEGTSQTSPAFPSPTPTPGP